MSIQIAVPFAPAGLDPAIYTGVAILSDAGIVKVGVAKVPYTAQMTSQYDGSNLEFVINSGLTTVLSTTNDGAGTVQVAKADVTWLAHPADPPSSAGLSEPVVIGNLLQIYGQPIIPYVMAGVVAIVQGARPSPDDSSIIKGKIIGLMDSGAAFDCSVACASEEFFTGLGLRQTTDGRWYITYFINDAPNLVAGPLTAGSPVINTTLQGQNLVDSGDPRFYGNSELGLQTSGAGPILLGVNAYRNSDGTFTAYSEEYNPDLDTALIVSDVFTRSGNTYTAVRNGSLPGSVQNMITEGGVQFDPSQPTAWVSVPVLSNAAPPVTTISYFWTSLVETHEAPAITVH
ncbi:MAG: hypothetical protein ACOH2R_08585 [Pseudomonas sp.]